MAARQKAMAKVSWNITKKYDAFLRKAAQALPGVVDKMMSDSIDEGVQFGAEVCAKDTTRLSRTVRKTKLAPCHYKFEAGHITGFDGKYVDYELIVEMEQPFMHPAREVIRENLERRKKTLKKFLLGEA